MTTSKANTPPPKLLKWNLQKTMTMWNLMDTTVVSHNKKYATLKNLPSTEFHTKDFVNQITKKYEVVDFQVSSLSVDEILAKLYKEFELSER